MSLKHGILGLLNYGSMTGYELAGTFKDSLSFFWQAQTSQIYRELAAMERIGWLTSKRVIQSDKPNKRVYSLTIAGKEELHSWLSTPEVDIREAMSVRSAFLMRVFFAGETDNEQALSMLLTFRERCMEAIADMDAVPGIIANYGATADNSERARYWSLVALFGNLYYRAEMEWVEEAIAMLEEKS